MITGGMYFNRRGQWGVRRYGAPKCWRWFKTRAEAVAAVVARWPEDTLVVHRDDGTVDEWWDRAGDYVAGEYRWQD